jgi:hypothetical protein
MSRIIAEPAPDKVRTGVKTCEIRVPALPEVIPATTLYGSDNALLRYTARPALAVLNVPALELFV